MPLRDHFHRPQKPKRYWDELHGGWPMKMVEALSAVLPPKYYAAPTVHLGRRVEIDIGTFEVDAPSPHLVNGSNGGGTATAVWTETEPTVSVAAEIPDDDEYSVKVYDEEEGRRLVAAIELVSPSNKDRPESRLAFVTKCAALLREEVSLTIVDVVTSRDFNLYAELLDHVGVCDPTLTSPPGLIYSATCRATALRKQWHLDAWHRPLLVGQPLPTLPVWLADDLAVTLDLEASYEDTCRVLRIA